MSSIKNAVENILNQEDAESSNKHKHVKLPQNLFGILSVDELPSTVTSPTKYIRFFPNGLLGIRVKLISKSGVTPVVSSCFLSFNNTIHNDVNVVGLRREIEMDGDEIYSFDPKSELPTQVEFIVDSAEVTANDSHIYFEAVQEL